VGVIHVRKTKYDLLEFQKNGNLSGFPDRKHSKGNSQDLSNDAEIRQVYIEERTMIRVKQDDGNDKDEKRISQE
jgi:hypothetical protein